MTATDLPALPLVLDVMHHAGADHAELVFWGSTRRGDQYPAFRWTADEDALARLERGVRAAQVAIRETP